MTEMNLPTKHIRDTAAKGEGRLGVQGWQMQRLCTGWINNKSLLLPQGTTFSILGSTIVEETLRMDQEKH